MASSRLRVLLAEAGLSETAIALRSLCASTDCTLELFSVTNRDSRYLARCDFRPDISLPPLALLQADPPAVLRLLHRCLREIPLILFADPADKELAVAGLEVGATDYMLGGYMDERALGRVLQAALRAELPPAPARDPQPSADANPVAIPQLLLSIHLSNFESVRTVEGPLAADGALQRVAVQLQKCVRRSDRIVYLVPDKFLVAVADCSESSLLAVHRRITSRLGLENQRCAAPLALSVHPEPWPSGTIASSEFAARALLPLSAAIAPASSLQLSSGYLP